MFLYKFDARMRSVNTKWAYIFTGSFIMLSLILRNQFLWRLSPEICPLIIPPLVLPMMDHKWTAKGMLCGTDLMFTGVTTSTPSIHSKYVTF